MLSRQLHEPSFTAGDCRRLQGFCRQLRPLLGRALAVGACGLYNGLPERLQAALRCLLEGDSEKQAASRLGLSRFTLHEYVGDLYRHFQVNSRPELLARNYEPSLWSARAAHQPLQRGLPLRLQEVLERLLAGDSEKQVAHRLRLSQHTVHEYVTNLYRRFGVHSRAQLLVTCRRERAA